MKDNNAYREHLFEEYEESLFRLAVYDASEREGLNIEAERNRAEEEQPSAQQINQFMKAVRLHGEKTAGQAKKKRIRIIHRLSATAALLAIVFLACMVTVDAFRLEVLNFLIRIEPKYTFIKLENNAMPDDWAGAYPRYVPEGYEVSKTEENDLYNMICYNNTADDSEIIIFYEYTKEETATFDTENADSVEKVTINGAEATLSVKNDMTGIFWPCDGCIYYIYGTVGTSEIIKMAESVEF